MASLYSFKTHLKMEISLKVPDQLWRKNAGTLKTVWIQVFRLETWTVNTFMSEYPSPDPGVSPCYNFNHQFSHMLLHIRLQEMPKSESSKFRNDVMYIKDVNQINPSKLYQITRFEHFLQMNWPWLSYVLTKNRFEVSFLKLK